MLETAQYAIKSYKEIIPYCTENAMTTETWGSEINFEIMLHQ